MKEKADPENLPCVVDYQNPRNNQKRTGIAYKKGSRYISMVAFGPIRVIRVPSEKIMTREYNKPLSHVYKIAEQAAEETAHYDWNNLSRKLRAALREIKYHAEVRDKKQQRESRRQLKAKGSGYLQTEKRKLKPESPSSETAGRKKRKLKPRKDKQ